MCSCQSVHPVIQWIVSITRKTCPRSINELVGRAPLRWSPLLVSCCWVRLLKAASQWLAHRWGDSPLHPSIYRHFQFLPSLRLICIQRSSPRLNLFLLLAIDPRIWCSFINSSSTHLSFYLSFSLLTFAQLPLFFLHLLHLCHPCSIHYQFTQSADHISQTADTYHTYQIDLFVCLFTCLVTNNLECVCIW